MLSERSIEDQVEALVKSTILVEKLESQSPGILKSQGSKSMGPLSEGISCSKAKTRPIITVMSCHDRSDPPQSSHDDSLPNRKCSTHGIR